MKVKDTDYTFLCANIRARETRLLSREQMLKMAEAASYDEAIRFLEHCDYPNLEGKSEAELEHCFTAHRLQILGEVARFCPEPLLLESFRLRFDYHNIKVAVKAAAAGVDASALFSASGNFDPALLSEALKKDNYDHLPRHIAEALREAQKTMLETGNPQRMDIDLDKHYYAAHLDMDRKLSDEFLMGYTRLRIDAVNLKTVIRCRRNGMDDAVLEQALIPGGKVALMFIVAAAHGALDLAQVFAAGDLQGPAKLGQAVLEGELRLSEFEMACDNALTRYLDNAKLIAFGTASVVAFLDGLESEIIAVRVILRGKLNGVSSEVLKERLCEAYV